ncbi:superoxide dismutase family protein [Streptomyces sp. NA04227]|uniref:superoxide dismutase family protein n=1 Tax=Streptomyces sp. NA04227 TaxID=2742136 RepID=UPI00159145E6|nr:superoxide dismutase family protein [Streptomyces sp. NA04227]QKW07323.1 superoxide dismutase family protein [Streptomyces sp. NA04227]
MRRVPRTALFAAAATALATVLGAATAAGATEPELPRLALAHGKFAPASEAGKAAAVTYDTKLAPEGAQAGVVEWAGADGATRIHLFVKGLVANRTYGAHAHTKPCGKLPADAGPHYQDKVDPVTPSVDSRYANPHNEVWLDLKTDRRGAAYTMAKNNWHFRDGGARAVVIHEMATATHDGHAGTAGARLACLNVPFA